MQLATTCTPVTVFFPLGVRLCLKKKNPKCSGQPVAWAILHFSVWESSQLHQTANQTFQPALPQELDIAIDNHSSPKIMRVRIKQSKTDSFRAGIDIYLGRTNTDLCPIVAVLSYLAVRGSEVGPLFRFNDGKPLTRQRLVNQVRTALQAQGIDSSRYSGHSFRIGTATTAAAAGIKDSTIQMLGRWQSSAFLCYIRTPRDQLAALTSPSRLC